MRKLVQSHDRRSTLRNKFWRIVPLQRERKSFLNWIIVLADQILRKFISAIDDCEGVNSTWFYGGRVAFRTGDKKMGCFQVEITCRISNIRSTSRNLLSTRRILATIFLVRFPFICVSPPLVAGAMRHGRMKFISEIYDRESSFLSLSLSIHYSWECTRFLVFLLNTEALDFSNVCRQRSVEDW